MKFRRMLCVAIVALIITANTQASTEIIVYEPNFDITLNGQKYDNAAAEYPIIVYKDITYIPLSWDMAGFMGLTVRFAPYGYSENPLLENYILYAGNGSIETEVLPTGNGSAPSSLTASIPEYQVVLGSGIKIDNANEEYPILNFCGVTYFPLTWRYAYEFFDWEYSFDSENGLIIDSRNAVRPRWDYMSLWNTSMHKSGRTDYVFAKHCYAGYPNTTFGGNYSFRYRDENGEEKIFSLEKELSDGDYYFNSAAAANQYGVSIVESNYRATLRDGILTIMCARMHEGNTESVLLMVDMKAEKVISKDIAK